MCINGNKGFNIKKPKSLINYFEYFFGEDQARYLIEIQESDIKKVKSILEQNSVYFDEIGVVQEKNIMLKGMLNVTVDELIKTNKTWLYDYISK